ncbi:hypothetical protein P4H66_18480 [Paenibacillus dokdonensis]|uniref:Uncharacterized protein n=1 Tax=Paenibacillus dokdonensis TaxID=2567944 RepID=A0ABU6GPZ7_9BACL|nr:hypothetical protein [Paenibacillus dokdonensis]MEC0241806.1 hypothetical protein [Paenibacillus dokdonensis]
MADEKGSDFEYEEPFLIPSRGLFILSVTDLGRFKAIDVIQDLVQKAQGRRASD